MSVAVAQDPLTVAALPTGFDRWRDLLDLILRAFACMDGVIDPPSSAHRLTAEGLRARAKDETVVLAMEGARIVGCIFLADRAGHVYIGKLAVDPGRQREGIGRSLLAHAERLALARARPMLELQTRVELTGNHAAFARLGFREAGRTAHPGYLRPTSITMRKDIAL